ncbi:MAG: inositol monophosphatase [Balneolales bacterium]|nr:inositol monophosphatase [Balneolales bacterium]
MPSQELQTAVEAARAGAAIIETYTERSRAQRFELKGRHDLVTEADVASEKAIKSVIRRMFPEDMMLAEESHEGAELTDARTWIIDPIDGTTNFAHGVPFYAVSIALWIKKQPEVALVLGVAQNELFTAEKGMGTQLNARPVHVSATKEASGALIGTGFPYRDLSVLEDYMKVFDVLMRETHGVRRPGSAAYDMAYVACGRYDGFYEYALAPWDVAAGALLIREAGGVVTDWHGRENWLTGKRITAGNPSIHTYLQEVIQREVRPELLSTTES